MLPHICTGITHLVLGVIAFFTASGSNVKVSSTSGAPDLILPAGAVVLSVEINDAGAGSVDLGTRNYVSGSVTGAAIANNLSVAAVGSITSGLTRTAISALSYVTVTIDTSGAGTVGGYITYFVADPTLGQQSA